MAGSAHNKKNVTFPNFQLPNLGNIQQKTNQGDINSLLSFLNQNLTKTPTPSSPSINKILIRSEIKKLIKEDNDFEQKLMKHLPEGHDNIKDLNDTISSPQFSQCLKTLNTALKSEECLSLIHNLGFTPNNEDIEYINKGGNIGCFLSV